MTDQGWMVDDGTCDACVNGACFECTKPYEEFDGEGYYQTCCCHEAYDIGWVEAG